MGKSKAHSGNLGPIFSPTEEWQMDQDRRLRTGGRREASRRGVKVRVRVSGGKCYSAVGREQNRGDLDGVVRCQDCHSKSRLL